MGGSLRLVVEFPDRNPVTISGLDQFASLFDSGNAVLRDVERLRDARLGELLSLAQIAQGHRLFDQPSRLRFYVLLLIEGAI